MVVTVVPVLPIYQLFSTGFAVRSFAVPEVAHLIRSVDRTKLACRWEAPECKGHKFSRKLQFKNNNANLFAFFRRSFSCSKNDVASQFSKVLFWKFLKKILFLRCLAFAVREWRFSFLFEIRQLIYDCKENAVNRALGTKYWHSSLTVPAHLKHFLEHTRHKSSPRYMESS